ncbi:MAG: tail tape measure protein [Sphingomonas sp.]|nr:MAG: tail tape measure protein [Sphingomonas sp.]
MDDELHALAVQVRTDSRGFAEDVAEMRAALRDGLGREADSVGSSIEQSLRRAARSGRLEFEDLGRAAARALGEIAGSALKLDGAGLSGLLGQTGTGLLGLPGRATGGPVAPGRAYVVGERGPEWFVPTSSGRIETGSQGGQQVRLTVNMTGGGRDSEFMAPTARQLAREVRRALERANG